MEPPPPRNVSQRRSPSRPSFQAPTKASLARAHPEVLERALSRSPTRKSARRSSRDDPQNEAETRAIGLRDRKALRPSITLTASPIDPLKRGQQSPLSFPSRRSSGLVAFAAPPRRVSKRISTSDLFFRSPTASQETRVEASLINTPEDQLASELGSATGAADMGDDDFESPSLNDGFDEPDLPPTPTQLGLERPPGRPRGLLSSSPSKEQWGKRRAAGDLEQSPSKLRIVDYGTDPEGSTEHVVSVNDVLLPESVHKKRKLRRELSHDLESLKWDVAKLEGLCEQLEQRGENIEPYLGELSSLLLSDDPSHTPSTNPRLGTQTVSSLISTLLPFSTKRPPKPRRASPESNPFALDQSAQTDLYLSALAPLKLTASSNIIPCSKSEPILERHQLILSPPSPFPPSQYRISVSYETNPETQCLVSLSADIGGNTPDYVRQWAKTRLANPLLKLDVSGLCWGINRYWEALVSRAQIWAQIEDNHSDLLPGRSRPRTFQNSKKNTLEDTDAPTQSDLRQILPHMERTSMLFESPEKSLLLSCELTIDEWTGEPELTSSICISTTGLDNEPSEKIAQDSKKLFQTIVNERSTTGSQSGAAGGSDVRAILRATDCVLGVLFGANSEK
ncbi:hypothetical protein BJX68DRAFT_249499 [Aspergillus pseudodeflectus]|uniref:Uncharacterized protein n=1 Tax=Aspergillus pseudodeflectus TaxID=176178 RepID=A0ABR4JCI5_9EURO